jgi:uncharacterized protein YlxP (DUF503 family)
VSVIAADSRHVIEMLDAAENLVAGRPEFDLLSAHRGISSSDDA